MKNLKSYIFWIIINKITQHKLKTLPHFQQLNIQFHPCKHSPWWRRLEEVFRLRLQDVLMKTNVFTLLIRLQKTSSRRFDQDQYIRLQDVFKTYHRVNLFLLTCFQDVFEVFSRRNPKTFIFRRICLGHTSEKFMVSAQNLQEWQKFLKF